MKTNLLFTQLLNIELPFSVSSVVYKDEKCESSKKKSVHIYISVDTGLEYRPNESIINGYEKRTWRHLNLFQYPCYIHCRVPKYQDKISKKVKTLEVPWAKSGLGFTLLFEEFAIELVKIYGCVAEVARQMDIYPQRLWRIVKTYGKKISEQEVDMSKVRKIGYDETSRKKGHDYITCFIDLDTGDLLYVVEGKGAETVVEFEKQSKLQGLDKEKISDISIDMSPAFISGAEKIFPNAEITFDKFHVSQLVQSRVLGTIVFVNPLGEKKVGELTNGYFSNLMGD
jgi:transposase